MSMIRAFIALNLSPEIYQGLEQVIKQLKERLPGSPVRWVPPKNIHLTIKFLGDVSVANLEILERILLAEASHCTSFEVSAGGLGAFPSLRRPRVVWIGVEAQPELYDLQRGIEAETARLGYAQEERDFSPHLTLGRVMRNASASEIHRLSEVLTGLKVGFLGAAFILSVNLYRSDLLPGGASYTLLFSTPLASNNS